MLTSLSFISDGVNKIDKDYISGIALNRQGAFQIESVGSLTRKSRKPDGAKVKASGQFATPKTTGNPGLNPQPTPFIV